jgi:hypothetical protein
VMVGIAVVGVMVGPGVTFELVVVEATDSANVRVGDSIVFLELLVQLSALKSRLEVMLPAQLLVLQCRNLCLNSKGHILDSVLGGRPCQGRLVSPNGHIPSCSLMEELRQQRGLSSFAYG